MRHVATKGSLVTTSYVPRQVDAVLEQRIRHHPAIFVVGPRACGKTTTAARLARTTIRLDEPRQAAVVQADPDAALRGLPEPVLVDEWQVAPEVLGAVKRAVDVDPRPGRFLVTGSVRGDLDAETWPGTGRLLRVPMVGLAMTEIERRIPSVPLLDQLAERGVNCLAGTPEAGEDLRDYAELAMRGGFPELVLRLPPGERAPWLDSYIDQLVTRDAAVIARRDPDRLRGFLEAYALNTAGNVELRTLYQSAGIAKATGEAYDELLRNLLVVDEVPAWWSNRLKRLVRSPKRYFVDSALALAAPRVDLTGLMADGSVLGRALDTFVLAQLRAEVPCCVSRPRLYHLRQEDGRHEADLVVEYGGGRIIAIEVKASSAPTGRDARHLGWLRDQLGDRFLGGIVFHTGPRAFSLGPDLIAVPIAALWNGLAE